jgi:hypothetical protein
MVWLVDAGARERFFIRHGKNEILNLYLLDRVSNIIYQIASRNGGRMSPVPAANQEDDMKFQSATHGTDSRRGHIGLTLSKENTLLASAVALAFAFVTACIFMLG